MNACSGGDGDGLGDALDRALPAALKLWERGERETDAP